MPIPLGTHCIYTPNPYGPVARPDLLSGMPVALHEMVGKEVRVVWPEDKIDGSQVQGYKVVGMNGSAFAAREDELEVIPPETDEQRDARLKSEANLDPGPCETCGHGPQYHDLEGFCECLVADCPCEHYAFDPLASFDEFVDPAQHCPHCHSFLLPETERSEGGPRTFACGAVEVDGQVRAKAACDLISKLYSLAYGCPDCGVTHRPENCRTLRVANKNAEIELMQNDLRDLTPLLQVLGKWRDHYAALASTKQPVSDLEFNAVMKELSEAYDEWREKQQ